MQSIVSTTAAPRSTTGELDDLAIEALEPINAPSMFINIAIALLGLDAGMLIAYYTK
jgi:hypothetical protein